MEVSQNVNGFSWTVVDTDNLIDGLSVSAVMGNIKTTEQPRQVSIMMTPIVDSFIKRRST